MILLLGVVAVLMIREPAGATNAASSEAPTLKTFFAGISFIRRTPVMLGAITLDLFAVLFGGAVALLPLFARDILHTGPLGLGILRSAPAVGALAAGVMLTRRPIVHRTGRTLLVVVGAFGVATVVFGLSKSFPLSLAALAVAGFVDMISVNIRSTIAIVAARTSCAAASPRSNRSSSAPRTSSARSSPASRRPCSAPSRRSSSAA